MKNYFGNIFHDAELVGDLMFYNIKLSSHPGDELAKKSKDKLIAYIENNLIDHKDDETPFTHNAIKRVQDIISDTNKLNASLKIFTKLNSPDKLKTLVYIKLMMKYKNISYDELKILIPAWALYSLKLFGDPIDVKSIIFNYSLEEQLLRVLEGLTPNEIFAILPNKKFYHGDKYGIKDYFYCMEETKKIGLDTPLTSESVEDFIMECSTNRLILKLGSGLMSLASDYNKWDLVDIINKLDDINEEIRKEEHLKKLNRFKVVK